MTDLHPEGEMDTQPENLQDTNYEYTDETSSSVKSQTTSGVCEDNADGKINTLTSQTGVNNPMTCRHSLTYEHGDDPKEHIETDVKSRVAPKHWQTDDTLENMTVSTEASQNVNPPPEDAIGERPDGGSDSSRYTVVLFGNSSSVQFGFENILLGEEQPFSDQTHVPRKIQVSGCVLTVFNILDLHEGDMYLDHVDHMTHDLIHKHNIQSFILVLKLGQFTNDDMIGLDWLEKTFGAGVLSFVMVLFMYERQEECDTVIDDLKNNAVLEQLMKKCGDRYCICSKNMNNQSEVRTLLEKIKHVVSVNNKCCYNAETNNPEFKLKDTERDRQEHNLQLKLAGENEESFGSGQDVHRERPAPTSEDKQENNGQIPNITDGPFKDENIKELFSRLDLDPQHKLKTDEFLKITASSLNYPDACAEKDLVHTFLHRLIMMDYTARYIKRKKPVTKTNRCYKDNRSGDMFSDLFESETAGSKTVERFQIHPMDIQMAAFHSADNVLRQLMLTKLSQCQYAVPLLVPSPITGEIEFPLFAFRQIKKSWKLLSDTGNTTSKCKSIVGIETAMVAFLRLGSVSSSKSQLLNNLINDRYHTFFDRNCRQDSKTRLLMNGVVEIAWYCPAGKNSDWLTDCVAFCNFHGDAGTHNIQREIVTKTSTVNVVLVSTLNQEIPHRTIIEELLKATQPLILLVTDSDSAGEELWKGKYRIGLKDRSQSDLAEELRETLKECMNACSSTFQLENIAKQPNLVVDEEKGECKTAKDTARRLFSLFMKESLPKIKEKYLPCQGELWHNWCHENKNLYCLMGHLENHKDSIKQKMYKLRTRQSKLEVSCLIRLFLHMLNAATENERVYFLKWVGILLESHTSDFLSSLHHEYYEQWSKVLDLKKKHSMSPLLSKEQAKLESISKNLNAATFGVEHILREMGQIFEASLSVEQTEVTNKADVNIFSLPRLAAEIIVTGYPLEIMDGDAAHVPLIWVLAVLDELVKMLGDKKVFVLSVLGIQSSGKSTMLNAMFGLQFAVSAGRCTRGAFMQLVGVSETMKKELKFDYILVVDSEGLRAIEKTEKTSIKHDNELATFVVGLGSLTLINIFGENPAEMQDILQIVVQAFLRMKKVKLNPSCLLVHQNVGDVTAGEKTMEGRRRLQEKLDGMTKLAAKEEDGDAQSFSDIIEFDVHGDVSYFAQLWEGSPPMAPPNPTYSENIDELRRKILSKLSTNRGVTLSQFKSNISDLWNALLNENFVFSFRNTLEIAAYRKLEHEYTKWTWSLRSAMLTAENKLLNRVNNERSLKIEEKDLVAQMTEVKKEVDKAVDHFFTEDHDKDILIQWREKFERKIADLYVELVQVVKRKLDHVYQQKISREKVDKEKIRYENKLFKLSKELAFNLKRDQTDENELRNKFNDVWSMWLSEIKQDAPTVKDINILRDVTQILSETYELPFVCYQQNQGNYKKLDALGDYSDYVIVKKSPAPHPTETQLAAEGVNETSNLFHRSRNFVSAAYNAVHSAIRKTSTEPIPKHTENVFSSEDNNRLRMLVSDVFQQTKNEIQRMSSAELGYNHSFIQQIIQSVKANINAYQEKVSGYTLKKEFTVDLCLLICTFAADRFKELHNEFKNANDVGLYLEKQKPQYFNIFRNYCNGANSAAVFGKFIVDKLEPSLLQAAFDQTAIDVAEKMKRDVPAFGGNRSNLEKHILTSLAEKDNFENYVEYLHKPKEHFNQFITQEVNKYLEDKCPEVLETIQNNIRSKIRCVLDAVEKTTEDVNKRKGNIDMWLENLSKELKDELQFKEESCLEKKEITDLGFLHEVLKSGLTETMRKLCSDVQTLYELKQEMFRKKPHKVLIEHLCRCCWAQCPFCNAICTNTMEDHDGDHRVRFHRNCGISGWSLLFSGTLGIDFCTTAVASDTLFMSSEQVFFFKEYRKAGGDYAKWNISPDTSEVPYWKWFVCRFQEDLEKYYKKKFTGDGEIPPAWRDITKEKAIESLREL